MGFTVYYRNENPVDEFTALRFMKAATEEIAGANMGLIPEITEESNWLRNGFDEGVPVLKLDEIWVNAGGETLYLTPERLTSGQIVECVKPCGNDKYRALLERVFGIAENILGGTFKTD